MAETGSTPDWALPPTPSLADIVADRVVEAIRSGQLKPGERIVEITLAKKLGVSRGPLREALNSLRAAHIIGGSKGQGAHVVDVSTEQVVQMLLLRGTLEGLAARLVVGRRTPALLQPLVELHAASVLAAKEARAADWRNLDWQFHEAVCNASGNEYLLRAWRSISNLVRLFLQNHPGFETHTQTVLRNHEALIDALTHGTPDQADARFRGGIIGSGFSRLGLPIPDYIGGITAPSGDAAEITPPKRSPRKTIR
jgi:DNA-binding GntR family transcriptional regulator